MATLTDNVIAVAGVAFSSKPGTLLTRLLRSTAARLRNEVATEAMSAVNKCPNANPRMNDNNFQFINLMEFAGGTVGWKATSVLSANRGASGDYVREHHERDPVR
jgi:hypothetical protein